MTKENIILPETFSLLRNKKNRETNPGLCCVLLSTSDKTLASQSLSFYFFTVFF